VARDGYVTSFRSLPFENPGDFADIRVTLVKGKEGSTGCGLVPSGALNRPWGDLSLVLASILALLALGRRRTA
jgi:hypothetical protein